MYRTSHDPNLWRTGGGKAGAALNHRRTITCRAGGMRGEYSSVSQSPVQRRRRFNQEAEADNRVGGSGGRAVRRSGQWSLLSSCCTSRSSVSRLLPVLLVTGLLLLTALQTSSGSTVPLKPRRRAVQLFRKPDSVTGQLSAVQEGLDVLRRQREPFCIISAVGPTRTGKSSILGRAFLRSEGEENLFEIGDGVKSMTGGIWITSEPIIVTPPGGQPLRVLLIDTEGFSGVGGLTSRTYEANLFGIVRAPPRNATAAPLPDALTLFSAREAICPRSNLPEKRSARDWICTR